MKSKDASVEREKLDGGCPGREFPPFYAFHKEAVIAFAESPVFFSRR